MDFTQAVETINGQEPTFLTRTKVGYICPYCDQGRNKGHGLTRHSSNKRLWFCVNEEKARSVTGLFAGYKGIADVQENFKQIVEEAAHYYGISIDSYRRSPEEDFKEVDGQNQDKTGQYTHTHTDTYTDKTERTHSNIGLDIESGVEAAHKALMGSAEAMKHFTDRGITPEIIERYRIGYASGGHNSLLQANTENQAKSKKAPLYKFVLPYIDSDNKVFYFQTEITDRKQIDEYNDKYRKINNVRPAPLFNERYIAKDAPPVIFLVEGIYDALSIEMAGEAAIAITGAGGDQRLIRLCRNYKPETVLVLYMDADTAGENYKKHIEEANLPQRLIVKTPTNGKDANEELMKNREAFTEKIKQIAQEAIAEQEQAEEEAKQEYLNTSAGASLQAFINGIAASVNTPCIPTGFEALDQCLDGGLYEGLYTIGAISSLGKTSFVLQICDQVAQAGHDVLIFSLEMAKTELMSKSISRLTYKLAVAEHTGINNAKTARGITTGKRYVNYTRTENELIQKAIEAYGAFADRIFISEGIGDIGTAQIRETVAKHIAITGRKPLVVVDYLQIVAPYNDRATDKQNTDKAVLELKRISRDYKIPVIAISSFNRDNYSAAVSMKAFKESGAVEYSSDILMGLQLKGVGEKEFDEMTEKKRKPRRLELCILKNRGGETGWILPFSYDARFNYFAEGHELTETGENWC